MAKKRKAKAPGVTLRADQDVTVGGSVIGRDQITNISVNANKSSLRDLIQLAHGLGDLSKGQDASRRQHWDRIADYLSQIAAALDKASAQMRERRAPYREYVMLQRYAQNFGHVVQDAFPGEHEQELQKFEKLLRDSITSIMGFDVYVLKFQGLPIPNDLYSGKAGLLRKPEAVKNPPLESAHFDLEPPTIEQLLEAAAVFQAEADRIRASSA